MISAAATIEFTESYEDLSDEQAFRFRFYCERCDSDYASDPQPCPRDQSNALLGTVGQILREATDSDCEPATDAVLVERESALRAAATQVGEHFHQCPQCGEWICDRCWNRSLLLCEKCAPSGIEQAARW